MCYIMFQTVKVFISLLLVINILSCSRETLQDTAKTEIIIDYHLEESVPQVEEVSVSEKDADILPAETTRDENVILFGRVPSTDVREMYDQHESLLTYLSSKLKKPVDLRFYASYAALIDGVANEEVDIAWFGPVSYVLAEQRVQNLPVNLYPLVKPQRHGEATLESDIIVRKDSNFKNIRDLENRNMAFVDPKSSAGFVLPIGVILDAGVNVGSVTFLRHYGNVAKAVYLGKFDGGSMYKGGHADYLTEEQQKEMKVLKRTEPVPREPLCWVSRFITEDRVAEIRDIFLNVPEEAIEALREGESLDKFHPADVNEYELLINLVGKVSETYEEISE